MAWIWLKLVMKNREFLKILIQALPYNLKCIDNEKTLDHNPTVDEAVIPLKRWKTLLPGNTLLMRWHLSPPTI